MGVAPVRTCIGCRQRAPGPELVRLVLAEGRVTVAGPKARAGRGASIHPREACVVAAVKTHAFARAFRAQVGVGLTPPIQKSRAASRDPRAVENSTTQRVGDDQALPGRPHRGRVWEPSQGSHHNDPKVVVDETVRSLIRDIEIAHEFQQPRAGRTP